MFPNLHYVVKRSVTLAESLEWNPNYWKCLTDTHNITIATPSQNKNSELKYDLLFHLSLLDLDSQEIIVKQAQNLCIDASVDQF